MTVSVASSGSTPFTLDNNPDLTSVTAAAGDYIVAGWVYRVGTEGSVLTTPTWNGQTMSQISTVDIGGTTPPEFRFEVFGVTASASATAAINTANSAGVSSVGGYAVLSGVHETPIGTPSTEMKWSSWTAPSLISTDSAAGDLILEIIATSRWNSSFDNLSATTWAPANSQTELFETVVAAGSQNPRLVFATKAGTGSNQTLGYTPSAGQPGFAHFIVTVKAAAGEVTPTKLTITSQPSNTVVGQTIPAVTVEAQDDDGELDTSFDGDVTVALETGDGTLAGTLTQAAVAGVATFDDLSINTLNTDAVLRFTSDGLTQADSDEFDITAGTGGVGGSFIGSPYIS